MPKSPPVGGVRRENFEEIAKAFIAANGGKGFMIAPRRIKLKTGYEIAATIREWGAWRAWRIGKRLSVQLMDRKGYYMVPTQWPHEFDADAHEYTDELAGNNFFDALVAAQRAAGDDRDTERRNAAMGRYLKTRPIPRDFRKVAIPPPERGPPPQSSEELKTQPRPASEELKRLLKDGSEFEGIG